MRNNHDAERRRIRAARYTPGPGFSEGVEQALHRLPKRSRSPVRDQWLRVSSIAAAVALLFIFAGPPVVRAAGELYQRLFGQIVEDIEREHEKPEDEKFRESIEGSWKWVRGHAVEGATATVGGVDIDIRYVRVGPLDGYDDDTAGELDIFVDYTDIPAFDPNWVDFVAVVDGEEIPLDIGENLANYRARGERRLNASDWPEDVWSYGNTEMRDGVLNSWLTFPLDDWAWDSPKALELRADIGGETLSISFAFDPAKARAEAEDAARHSLPLMEEIYQEEKNLWTAVRENAVPIGLTGSAGGLDWMISEISYANEQLFFTVMVRGVEEKNPKIASHDIWLEDLMIDGMRAHIDGSRDFTLDGGVFTTVFQGVLLRNPENLPKESILSMEFSLGDERTSGRIAFKYNWSERRATLAKDEAEMRVWIEQARSLGEALDTRSPEYVGYDLRPLNLVEELDGLSLAVTGLRFWKDAGIVEFAVDFRGDLESSPYGSLDWPVVTINGHRAFGTSAQPHSRYSMYPPLHISEFGNGDDIVLEFPLYGKDADWEMTDHPEPAAVLRYAFTVDAGALPPLADNHNR